MSRAPGVPPEVPAHMTALLGIIALRRGEVENCIACVGPSSCIFPIAREAGHTQPAGSREAIAVVHRVPRRVARRPPRPLAAEHRLHDAGRVPGQGPAAVPDPDSSRSARSSTSAGSRTWRPLVGLIGRGPEPGRRQHLRRLHRRRPARPLHHLARRRPGRLALRQPRRRHVRGPLRRGRARRPGLRPERHPRRLRQRRRPRRPALARRPGRSPLRLSLLRNKGDGVFEDVTIASGLAEPIATESAAWGDYDNDGWLDLFVCGEYLPARPRRPRVAASPTRGTAAGSTTTEGTARSSTSPPRPASPNERCAKGSAWGDYDGDGRLDLFVSNMDGPCRLYHNEGDGTFRDVAPALGVTGPPHGFACWFWDYDNDGRLDLFVNDYSSIARRGRGRSPRPAGRAVEPRPRLYRNLGADGFRDVSREVGLDRPMPPMGVQLRRHRQRRLPRHLPRDRPDVLSGLVPNLMFKNVEGSRFEDVTDVVRHRPPPEGARRLVRRLGLRRRPRPLRRARRRLPRRQGVQRPVPEPRPRPPLAEGQAGRHQDQPLGARGQDPGRRARRRRHAAVDLPHDRQQRQLRRQQPGRVDRPARRDVASPS